MARQTSRPNWVNADNMEQRECPIKNDWQWASIQTAVKDYPVPKTLTPDDSSLFYRTIQSKFHQAQGSIDFIHDSDLIGIQGNFVDVEESWVDTVLPPEVYPVPEPTPVEIPPIKEPPRSKAGEPPEKPNENFYGTIPKGFLDSIFGSGRREEERKRFEIDNRKWEKLLEAWERVNSVDVKAARHYERLEAIYDATVNDATTKYVAALEKWTGDRDNWSAQRAAIKGKVDFIKEGFYAGKVDQIEQYFNLVLRLSAYPAAFPRSISVVFDEVSRILLVELQLPNLMEIPICKSGPKGSIKAISERERKSHHEYVAFAIAVRTLYELSIADETGCISTVALNGWIEYTDRSDGHRKRGFVLSIAADPVKVRGLNLQELNPKEAFKSFAGRASPNLADIVSVTPVLTLDRKDRRVVESNFQMGALDVTTNLAAMPWEDFEHLVRELFSRQFSGAGAEVKVTRASRDGGVDAIAWDPDPVRGGKFVIQAKRYTNTVGVSAVRDLYGTLINEGANRGLLVTTSGFGPDAIEFAKDKAISLIDGQMLLGMLKSFGYSFRIDLVEARRLAESRK